MKNQTIILLVIACACGLVAMLGVKQQMSKQDKKVPTKKVLVATAPINFGEAFTDKNTDFIDVEDGKCPADAVTDRKAVKNRSSRVPRSPGDWICRSHLSEEGEIGAVGNIPKGMRVVTIPVDPTTIHSGMLQPGNRIDLFLTYKVRDEGSRREKETTVPLLEYIEVFAVDNQKFGVDATSENAKASNISLLVKPDQAMKLTTAKRKGIITTLLRPTDDDISIAGSFSEDDLINTGSQIDKTSSLDTLENDEDDAVAFNLDTDNIRSQLQNELKADEDDKQRNEEDEDDRRAEDEEVPPEEETWTIAIHQNGQVRFEEVSLHSSRPVRTQSNGSLEGSRPVSNESGAVPELPGALIENDDQASSSKPGSQSLEDLEKAAMGLLDELY